MNATPLFSRVTLIGIGLIGSSLARAMRAEKLAGEIVVATRREETLKRAIELGLCDRGTLDAGDAVRDADLVIIGKRGEGADFAWYAPAPSFSTPGLVAVAPAAGGSPWSS